MALLNDGKSNMAQKSHPALRDGTETLGRMRDDAGEAENGRSREEREGGEEADVGAQEGGQIESLTAALMPVSPHSVAPAARHVDVEPWSRRHRGKKLKLVAATILLVLFAIVLGFGAATYFISSRAPQATPQSEHSSRACSLTDALATSAASGLWGTSRPLSKLSRPLVLLISSDGFRSDYILKIPNSNISRLVQESTVALDGLIPPFPSITFPSHYSMATGLYPPWHGIISNYFVDAANHSSVFTPGTKDPVFWLGEPIWETVTKQGLKAATMFWPGSNVNRSSKWSCPSDFCFDYNATISFEQRVDTVLEWVDRPDSARPSLITLYFEEPDEAGHRGGGPDTLAISTALLQVDAAMGRLLAGLKERGVLDDVSMIMVGDHGMATVCDSRQVILADFGKKIHNFDESWITLQSILVGFAPPEGADVDKVLRQLVSALPSVRNGDRLKLYRKDDFPERFKFYGSSRIPPILGLVEEGYLPLYDESDNRYGKCMGAHGYDNMLASMRTIFYARGPRFAHGRSIPSFDNIEIYNLIARILNVSAAPNNGSSSHPDFVLLPE